MLEAGADASYPMLTVLGGLAEFERDLIRGRTSDGWERAKARDVKLGRKAETDRTPEVRDDPAAGLSTARRCEKYASISTRFRTPISVRSLTNESRTALSDG